MKAYILIQRYAGGRYVREWQYRWPDEAFVPGGPNPTGHATVHQLWDAKRTATEIARGGITPAQAGVIHEDSDFSLCAVYVDDLHLCPLCGRFWIEEMKEETHRLHHSPRSEDKLRLVHLRRAVPEFDLCPCRPKCDVHMTEEFQEQMKKELEARQQQGGRHSSPAARPSETHTLNVGR